jgi:glutaredoxin
MPRHTSPYLSTLEWVVIVREGCPACIGAKELLNKRESERKDYLNIDRLDPVMVARIRKLYADNWATLPIIFYKGKFIGGFAELKSFTSSL